LFKSKSRENELAEDPDNKSRPMMLNKHLYE